MSVPRRNKEGGGGGGGKERNKKKKKRPGWARVVAISRQHVWDRRVSRHCDVWCVAGGRGAEGVGQKALFSLPVVSVC